MKYLVSMLVTSFVFASLVGTCTQETFAFQKRRQRFGNGALLRRIFGKDDEDKKDKKKSSSDKESGSRFLKGREEDLRRKLEEARRELDLKMKRLHHKVAEKFSLDPNDLTADRRDDPTRRDVGRSVLSREDSIAYPNPKKGNLRDSDRILQKYDVEGSRKRFDSLSGRTSDADDIAPPDFAPLSPTISNVRSKNQSSSSGIPKLHVNQDPLRGTGNVPPNDLERGDFLLGNRQNLFGAEVSDKRPEKGLLVTKVLKNSHAKKFGLKRGDWIVKVAGIKPGSLEDIDSLLKILGPEDQFEMEVISGGKKSVKSVTGLSKSDKVKATADHVASQQTVRWPLTGNPAETNGNLRNNTFQKNGNAIPAGVRAGRLPAEDSTIAKLRRELALKNERIRKLEQKLESANSKTAPPDFKPLLRKKSKSSAGDNMDLELDSPNG